MTLHLTRDEWERIAAEGGGVLFREGQHLCAVPRPGEVHDGVLCRNYLPPAEFVEATQPCETCHGQRKIRVPYSPIVVEVFNTSLIDCPNCLDGKRRIAVVVPCHCGCHDADDGFAEWDCRCNDGFVTVGHVVVEWGPLVVHGVTDWPDGERIISIYVEPEHGVRRLIHIPPDIDPQSLVGQYAIGVEVVR